LLEVRGLARPRLVVLSACETGLSEITRNPDEFIGLPGAFTTLGATGVVGTLWPVSDAATALLMAKFYQLHLDHRLSPPTALSRAQAWLRSATNDDLQTFAGQARARGRLSQDAFAGIARQLSAEALARSRNSMVVQWVERTDGPSGSTRRPAQDRLARPYAHPYFWAGFIYTGL
jgi:CHAT domain-containing protein